MKISADCVNQDHRALGVHTIDCAPLNAACLYPTDLVWAEATGQPLEVLAPLEDDQNRNDPGGAT